MIRGAGIALAAMVLPAVANAHIVSCAPIDNGAAIVLPLPAYTVVATCLTGGVPGKLKVTGNKHFFMSGKQVEVWDKGYYTAGQVTLTVYDFSIGSNATFILTFEEPSQCAYPWPWVTPEADAPLPTNSCGGSGLPAKARMDAKTPFVQP